MVRGLRRPRPEPVPARYARVLDGETLWLAVEGGAATLTLRYAGGERTVPTEPDPAAADDGLVSARAPLGPLGDVPAPVEGPLTVEVLAGEGRAAAPVAWTEAPVPGPVRAAIPTRDRRWRWRVTAPAGRLLLLRTVEPPAVPVLRLAPHDDDRGVRVETEAPHPPLEVRADEHDLAPGEQVDLLSGDLPLVRAHDDLRRPQHAVDLPTLGDDLRLRWLPDGRLALSRDRG